MPKALSKWWLLASALLLPFSVFAHASGEAASSCLGCHGQGSQQTTLTVTPALITPGALVTVHVTIRGTGKSGGLALTTSNGVGLFSLVSGQGTRLENNQVLHSAPKASAGGEITFDAQWTAPVLPGGTVFEVATVLANGDGTNGGDQAGAASLAVVWGCAGTTYSADLDGDGVGAVSSGTVLDCAPPAGYSARAGDCDDHDATVSPDRPEACNGRDDDCNGKIDDGLASTTTWPDLDRDGFGDAHGAPAQGCTGGMRASNQLDCDDTSAMIHPGAMEICNQRDDDCNGQIDEGAKVRCGKGWCGRFGPSCDVALCKPGDPLPERCNDFDDDCDGVVDNGDLCGSNAHCVTGHCIAVDAGVPDAGASGGLPPATTCSCDLAPASLSILALFVLARRLTGSRFCDFYS